MINLLTPAARLWHNAVLNNYKQLIVFTLCLIVVVSLNSIALAQSFEYLPGDANMINGQWPPKVIGGDVTFMVNYFRNLAGINPCLLDSFWASADANGDCQIIGSDVTRLVTYFRGLDTIGYCSTYIPAWSVDNLPESTPTNWPNCGYIPANHAPVIAGISSQTITIGDTLNLRVTATDQEYDIITLYGELLPDNSVFTDSSEGIGGLTFIPVFSQIGQYSVRFIASDSEFADTALVSITVQDTLSSDAIIADHTFCDAADSDWLQIPEVTIDSIMAHFNMYYQHTSHGSQIITGCAKLYEEEGFPDFSDNITEVSNHVGTDGDTTWAPVFRTYLNNHPECNIASISWCWEHLYYTEAETQAYLDKMNELEAVYPNVVFIYQTGRRYHPDDDPELNHRRHNEQIRQYCIANDKVLFDFEYIESYDPDGNYYDEDSDACAWCTDWCADTDHDCSDDCSCAHSHCFNCWQKGRAWWVMLEQLWLRYQNQK